MLILEKFRFVQKPEFKSCIDINFLSLWRFRRSLYGSDEPLCVWTLS